MISAAAAKRSIAAIAEGEATAALALFVIARLRERVVCQRSPTPAAVASPLFKNERRLVAAFMLLHISCIKSHLTSELALSKTRQVSEQSNSFVICLLVFDDNPAVICNRAYGSLRRLARPQDDSLPLLHGGAD